MASWGIRRVAEACASSVVGQIAAGTSRIQRAPVAFVRFPTTTRSLHYLSQRLASLTSDPSCSSSSPSALPLSISCASPSDSRVGFRRPEEIPWHKSLTNRVTLIGHIDRSVDIKYLDSGKIVASSSIRVKRAERDDITLFALQFWDELAEIAAAHLKKGDRVYIAGAVWVENYVDKDSLQKSICKVVVRDLKFVGDDYRVTNDGNTNAEGQFDQKLTEEDQWNDYFQNPNDYWDNRVGKKNPRGPDFKHKASGAGLWIDSRNAPSWVVERLGSVPPTISEAAGTKDEKVRELEKLWQAFFANPTDWWDNRNSKRTPKHPDFRHKVSGEGLWIENFNNPSWVKSQLEALDSKAKSVKEGGGRVEWASGAKERGSKTSFEDDDLGFF